MALIKITTIKNVELVKDGDHYNILYPIPGTDETTVKYNINGLWIDGTITFNEDGSEILNDKNVELV